MCSGELLAVQSARSQTNHRHVPDSRVSVGYTGQDLNGGGESSDPPNFYKKE